MVDMSCEGCVKTVKNKLQTVNGIKSIDVDLSNQVVRIFGSSPVKIMGEALEQTGRKARLIGQGSPGDVLISAAVVEFKGPQIFGVVRLALVSMALARIEAKFSGLSPGKHGCSINEFGDLTRGAASTGKLYNLTKPLAGEEVVPTIYTNIRGYTIQSNQFSVTEHYKSPEVGRRSLPGVFFFYDLSPIKVTFAETHMPHSYTS